MMCHLPAGAQSHLCSGVSRFITNGKPQENDITWPRVEAYSPGPGAERWDDCANMRRCK